MYYLKLSGYIPESKQMEFEQTYRFMSTQMPQACRGYNIMKDALNDGIYYFISYWKLKTQVQSFSFSTSFCMLKGAFNTLGELYENEIGEMMEMEN